MKREFSNEIIYQIFPERFNIGNGASLQKKINNGKYSKSVIAKQWHELPQESGESQFEMFGGDLPGVSEKMDYICELGATAIYLTPIFPSESNHKYDAYDYYSIDRAFGGDEIFKQLLEEVHRRGLKLIIDLVLNHLSDTHPFFQAALNDYNSPYRDYFCFTEYPHEYSCWWGYKSMPELNLANEAVINEFITGE